MEFEPRTFAVWCQCNGHNTKENPVKVNAECCAAGQEEDSLYLGKVGSLSQLDFPEVMTNYSRAHGLDKKCRKDDL